MSSTFSDGEINIESHSFEAAISLSLSLWIHTTYSGKAYWGQERENELISPYLVELKENVLMEQDWRQKKEVKLASLSLYKER